MDLRDSCGIDDRPISCPLCRSSDVIFRQSTATWLCRACAYTWYTIGHCDVRR